MRHIDVTVLINHDDEILVLNDAVDNWKDYCDCSHKSVTHVKVPLTKPPSNEINVIDYRIVPVGEGKFVVQKVNWLGKWITFKIDDISPGHGGSEVWPMQGSRKDCEKVIRFLRHYCKKVKLKVDWQVMNRISRKLKIDYMYYQGEIPKQ